MQSETAVLVMTDMHYGKKTPTFSPEVCCQRLGELSQRLGRVRDLLKTSYDIDQLTILLLGDINDGTDIYASQPHHQAVTNVEQQAREAAGLLAGFLNEQADIWSDVRVECVLGNHGRAGKWAHEAANWDMVAYRYMQMLNQDKRVTINIPDGNPFLRVIQVRGHGILMYHGHDIRSYGSIPWYGMLLRLLRWRSTRSLPPWQLAVMGHFHTLGYWNINAIQMMASGTMVSDDEWSLQTFGWEPSTTWWLFGVSNSRPITWQFPLSVAPDLIHIGDPVEPKIKIPSVWEQPRDNMGRFVRRT